MSDSAKPSCSSCGGIVDTSTNTSDSGSPVSTDQTLCSGCSCGSEACGSATPCEEDHTNTVCVIRYAATVKVLNSFNFPGIGESVSLTLENVTRILPGAVLWNQTIGYLHILSYDAETGVAVAQNKGDAGNVKDAGDLIPECTEFIVGIVSTAIGTGSNNSDIIPYLDADFIAPADGSCQLASVTNINGIAIGDVISINSFQYRVNSIPDAVTLELCNEGDGAPTGQVIEHDANCDGVQDVQVVVLSSDDPCSREGVQTGQLVVCDGTGIRRPLIGTVDGQVAVWDSVTENWILVNSNLVEECTALSACAIFDIGDTGPYVIFVVSTALFTAGDKIVIGEGTDTIVATIQDIIDATQLRIVLDVAPSEVLTYDPPTRVCLRDCCEDFSDVVEEIENLTERVVNLESEVTIINNELNATIRQPCYPAQMLEHYQASDFYISNAGAPFVPTDLGGGIHQRHYDIGDVHEFNPKPVDFSLGPYTCDVVIAVTIHMDISLANFGPDIDQNSFVQLHELMMSLDGDVTSESPKQFAVGWGGDPFSSQFSNPEVPPANFRLDADTTVGSRVNAHFARSIRVNAGNTFTCVLEHRLSLDGAINGINWANNGYIWSFAGMPSAQVFRI